MYKCNLNFDIDFDEILKSELSELNYSVGSLTDSEEIRTKYFNFKRRSIKARQRTVLISNEFSCPIELQNGLASIKRKFELGEDLTPHLSKSLTNLDYNDSLLNDWGIHHLHLGEALETNGSGFIVRTGPVLFARIEHDKAYFINVLPHGSWTDQDMVKVIHDNWPESIENYLMKGIIGLVHVPSNEDIKLMRKHGINSGIEIAPSVVYLLMGGGLTTAKTSIEVTRALIYFKKLIPKLQEHIENNLQAFGNIISEKTGQNEDELNFKLTIEDGTFYAVESRANLAFPLGKY
jgi:hypothetical protein